MSNLSDVCDFYPCICKLLGYFTKLLIVPIEDLLCVSCRYKVRLHKRGQRGFQNFNFVFFGADILYLLLQVVSQFQQSSRVFHHLLHACQSVDPFHYGGYRAHRRKLQTRLLKVNFLEVELLCLQGVVTDLQLRQIQLLGCPV